MKKYSFIVLLIFLSCIAYGQTRIYSTTGIEIPFSFASIDAYESTKGNSLRFAPFPNFNEHVNFDFGNNFGIYTGVNIRNIGFIYDTKKSRAFENIDIDEHSKKKFRTISIGLPIGLKLGNFKKFFFYGGYEIGFPIHYKEKTIFENSKKNITKEWFSNKTSTINHNVFFGVEFPYSLSVKFNWAITKFFNSNCNDKIEYLPVISYKDFHANVYYFSISWNILENFNFYYERYLEKADEYYY